MNAQRSTPQPRRQQQILNAISELDREFSTRKLSGKPMKSSVEEAYRRLLQQHYDRLKSDGPY